MISAAECVHDASVLSLAVDAVVVDAAAAAVVERGAPQRITEPLHHRALFQIRITSCGVSDCGRAN